MVQILPTLAFLAIIVWFYRRSTGRPVVQIYALIVSSYLNLFPLLDFLFSGGEGTSHFMYFQVLVILFFEMPLILLLGRGQRGPRSPLAAEGDERPRYKLSPGLPIFLAMLLIGFWRVALGYDLFFRRLGHEALRAQSESVPSMLLYVYRGAVETSFFVIIYLVMILRSAHERSRYYGRYKLLLAGYLVTFILFFGANSRMQLMLLLLCLIASNPKVSDLLLRKVKLLPLALAGASLLIGLTLVREFYFEHNDRLNSEDLAVLFRGVGWLIAGRLDSLVILNRLHEAGFKPFWFDLSGILHLGKFYWSFFADPATYTSIKDSLVTSPSVAIVNRLLQGNEVDFPKSMILDSFLSFGVLGLTGTSIILGTAIRAIQRRISRPRIFSVGFIVAIFFLPMLLEFEKEFFGLFFSALKWAPFLALMIYFRPKRIGRVRADRTVPAKTSQEILWP